MSTLHNGHSAVLSAGTLESQVFLPYVCIKCVSPVSDPSTSGSPRRAPHFNTVPLYGMNLRTNHVAHAVPPFHILG